jgi:uroporphyrin-III C-methyltransferase/precorrin-2 dehydrogenase/sirohydrochlorin ferrochelatase
VVVWFGGSRMSYPISLELTGRRVVVVGAGAVAARRARGLLDAGADVQVIAPEIGPEMARLEVSVAQRSYVDGDVAGAWLVQACTDDPDVNARVAAEAERLQIPCVRADFAPGGSARTPAVTRSGPVTLAVTAGDPAASRDISAAMGALLDTGAVPVRPRRSGMGSVALVGGGPGDPDLITVRGRRLIAAADVIVTDRLGPRGLLASVDVEVIDVGKTPYRHGTTQPEINELLVDRARKGLAVVRLKGGDPFIFGRGGEEVAACVAAGVPVQVVPGVTSAVAGPSAVGIPLTHRGIAADFTVVSAHLAERSSSTVDWEALAQGSSTLVLLMAMGRLKEISKTLVSFGKPGSTPVAVIQDATLPSQRAIVSTLDTLAEDVESAGLRPPAVVVVGEVVRLASIDRVATTEF